eukprot:6176854-Pleurochrysis_carterae.AAC.3
MQKKEERIRRVFREEPAHLLYAVLHPHCACPGPGVDHVSSPRWLAEKAQGDRAKHKDNGLERERAHSL